MTPDGIKTVLADHVAWLGDPSTGKRAILYCANLSGANLSRASLYGAILYGADLSDANLSGANLSRAKLSRAKLSGANLSDADLSRADLSGASLSDAKLSRADLSDANLSGTNLYGASVIDAGQDSRRYRFVANLFDGTTLIAAGCRWFTVPQALEHWTEAHRDNPALRQECLAKVELIRTVAVARGWDVTGKES